MKTESLTTSAELSIAEAVVTKLQQLPLDRQQEVLNFVEFLVQKSAPSQSMWEKIAEIAKQVPEEVWNSLPTDGAEQHDHYLYSIPKKES